MSWIDFKLFLRTLRANRLSAFINLLGLSVGMAAFLLIGLFILHEFRYDRFHENADRLVRIVFNGRIGQNQHLYVPISSSPMGPNITHKLSDVENWVRLDYMDREEPVRYEDKMFLERHILWADSGLFDLFDLQLVAGNPSTALAPKDVAVISEATAKKYFGSDDPLGKKILFNNRYEYTISGVFRDLDQPSDFFGDVPIIASYSSLERDDNESWISEISYQTFLLLAPNADPAQVREEIQAMFEERDREFIEQMGGFMNIELQALKDVHLYSNDFTMDARGEGSIHTVRQFATIAVFILLLAVLNFVNLSTARSATRAKQVGVSKAVGASRRHLARQFLMESVLLAFGALLLAVILVELLLPTFGALLQRDMRFGLIAQYQLIPFALFFALLVGTVAGTYPAFFLSSFRPVSMLKSKSTSSNTGARLRAALVVLQFAISITLIASTLIMKQQVEFARNKKLGYDREQLLTLNLYDSDIRPQHEALIQSIEQLEGVESVTSALSGMVGSQRNSVYLLPGREREQIFLATKYVQPDFVQKLGMSIVAGRDFDEKIATDKEDKILLNRAAARMLGWEDDPVGKQINDIQDLEPLKTETWTVIGMVEDFHFESLREAIRPIVIKATEYDPRSVFIRLKAGDIESTVNSIEEVWKRISDRAAFDYYFVDERYDEQYKDEIRNGRLFTWFTGLAIIIACMGLFALAAFAAEQRRKEVGIRKVLGASSMTIVSLLARDFLKLVGIAYLLAVPASYFLMNQRLEQFAYRIEIGVGVYLVSAVLAILVAGLMVAGHAYKAANTDPVKSLRYE
ncbi:FtsX-like permease family protein [bacterium]|nr:FtsX-like permease family protein [bacterium]